MQSAGTVKIHQKICVRGGTCVCVRAWGGPLSAYVHYTLDYAGKVTLSNQLSRSLLINHFVITLLRNFAKIIIIQLTKERKADIGFGLLN